MAEDLLPVHFGHHDIEADEVVGVFGAKGHPNGFDGFPAIGRTVYRAKTLEELLEEKAAGKIVVHDQGFQSISYPSLSGSNADREKPPSGFEFLIGRKNDFLSLSRSEE